MPTLSFKTKFKKNEGLIISPSELREIYLHGVEIKDRNGNELSDDTLKTFILTAQQDVERAYNIKIDCQAIFETRDFLREEYWNWTYLRVAYPVIEAYELSGNIGGIKQRDYPTEWLVIKQSSNNSGRPWRNIHLIPNRSNAKVQDIFFAGSVFVHSRDRIPNYWHVTYVTGIFKLPYDLLDFIGKMASINAFHIAGDLILGAGIASQSIGIDGLSESISTTSSATNAGYGARIEGYYRDMQLAEPKLKNFYKGYTMTTL